MPKQNPGKVSKKFHPGAIRVKTPQDSAVITTEMVLPPDTNAIGTVFGGTVVSWVDIAAAICARRHAREIVVTASIDALHFIAPIQLGDVVTVRAMVNHAFRTSMEIGVRVDSENPATGKQLHNVSAYLTFVALNKSGKPTPVPALSANTEDEKRRAREAIHRKETRIRLAQQLKTQNRS